MLTVFIIIAFILFLFIGSFFGVLIDRIYRGEQFVKGHSYCEHCKHELKTLDLIPVFSYLFLNGRCRYCKKEIPAWLPTVEIVTTTVLTSVVILVNKYGILSLFIHENFPSLYPALPILSILVALSVASVFILIFMTDAKYMVIPEAYLYLLALLYPLYFIFFKFQQTWPQNFAILKDDFIAGILLAAFFAVLHYGSRKKAMGEGDIYLGGLIGLYLGTTLSIIMWFVAFLTGATLGVILLIVGKKKLKSALPFGPFLIIGFVFAILYGVQAINWYLNLSFSF